MIVNKTVTWEFCEGDKFIVVFRDMSNGNSLHIPNDSLGEINCNQWKCLGHWKIKSN